MESQNLGHGYTPMASPNLLSTLHTRPKPRVGSTVAVRLAAANRLVRLGKERRSQAEMGGGPAHKATGEGNKPGS